MPLLHSETAKERRRRALRDQMLAAGAVAAASAGDNSDEKGTHQENTVLQFDSHALQRQARISDLIPKTPVAFLLWFLAGLAVVVGLEALYAWMPDLAAMTTDGRVAAFDLDSEGSLGAWFSSTTLMLASLLALVVWSIRRHKPDDYHARYRIWAWAAAWWMILAIDEGASLHEGFKELAALLTGFRPGLDGSLWWVAAYLPPLSWLGVRLVLEMKPCRSSLCALGATACCYAAAVFVHLGWLLPETGARGVMVEEGCEMVGNLFLSLSMALHARYVILEAQGLLPTRATAQAASESSRAETPDQDSAAQAPLPDESSVRRVDGPHPIPPPASRQPEHAAAQASSIDAVAQRPPTAAATPRRKLTKAERKALRRHQYRDDELD